MNKKYAALMVVGCLLTAPAMATELSPEAQLSYSLGYQFGENVHNNHIPIQPQIFTRAIHDALTGAKPLLPPAQMAAVVAKFQKDMKQRQMAMLHALGMREQAAGRAFLAQNAKKPGVRPLPGGAQYQILQSGNGARPSLTSTVEANYTGAFINGHEFASTKKSGKAAVFPVQGIIPGLQEALVRMPVGSKWRVFVPGHLAYGPNGNGPIPPNATLVFTIHLIGIK